MLRLGMILLGSAFILHYRRNRPEKVKEESPDDSDSTPGTPGGKPPDPTLDPALQYLIPAGPSQPGLYDVFQSIVPFPGFGGQPTDTLLNPPGQIGTVAGGMISRQQLSAANNLYKGVTGLIPTSLRQEYVNMKRLADFKGRLRAKLKFW